MDNVYVLEQSGNKLIGQSALAPMPEVVIDIKKYASK